MKYRTLNALTVGWQSSSILKLEFCTYCILVTFVLHLPLLSILSNNVLDLQHFSTYSFYLPLFSTFLCCTLSIFSLISSISARTTFYLPLFSSIMCWTSITLKFAFRTYYIFLPLFSTPLCCILSNNLLDFQHFKLEFRTYYIFVLGPGRTESRFGSVLFFCYYSGLRHRIEVSTPFIFFLCR